ncbi:MAG TPA: TolC family protein [bacterium]|nr:TolC family protein [bacterium]
MNPIAVGILRPRSAALLATALLTGCAPFHELSDDVRQRIADESRPLSPTISDHRAVRDAAEAAMRGEVPLPEAFAIAPDAGLDDFVHLALARNPRLQARIRDLEALGMRVPQVSSLSDPMLSLIPPTGSLVETAGGQMTAGLGLAQGLPWPGKLETLGKAAEQVVRVALANLDSERLRIIADTKNAYYDLYRAKVSVDVTTELERLLQSVRDSAAARVAVGAASQQDLLRLEVELYDLSNRRIDFEQQRATARARLNVLMDRAVDAPLPDPAPIDLTPLQWRLLSLLRRADEHGPQLLAMRQRIGIDLLRRAYADLAYYPDLSLGGLFSFIRNGGRSPVADGADIWNLNLGLTLPIWTAKLDAGVLQRNAEALASALRYRDARNEVLFTLQRLLVEVDASYRRAVLLRDGILARALQAVRVAQSGYDAGSVEFATLIAGWRRLLDLQLDYHRTLAALEQNVSEVERVAGGDLQRSESPEE